MQCDFTEAGDGSGSCQSGMAGVGSVDGSDLNVYLHWGFPDTPVTPLQHLDASWTGLQFLFFFPPSFIHHNSVDRGEVAIGMHRQYRQIHHPEYRWEIIPFPLHAAGIRPP